MTDKNEKIGLGSQALRDVQAYLEYVKLKM